MPQQIARTKHGPIEYRLEGDGPVVMVLNGGHCSRASRLSHERLAGEGFAVLTPSRPGYDATPAAIGRTAQAAADALAALLATLQIPSVSVIGISAAGPTALAFAQRHRGSIAKLILESAVTLPWEERLKRTAPLMFGRGEKVTWGLTRLALRLWPNAVIRVLLQEMTTLEIGPVMQRMGPAELDFVRRMIAAMQSGTGFINDLGHTVADLGELSVPVLAMYSPHDRPVPPRHAQRIAGEVRNAEIYAVPSDSHLIWIGPHAEQLWQKRLTFLRQ